MSDRAYLVAGIFVLAERDIGGGRVERLPKVQALGELLRNSVRLPGRSLVFADGMTQSLWPDPWHNKLPSIASIRRMASNTCQSLPSARCRRCCMGDEVRADFLLKHGLGVAQHGRSEAAVQFFRESLALNESLAARRALVKELVSSKQLDEAAALIEQTNSLYPYDVPTLNQAAILLTGKGQIGEAIAHLEAAIGVVGREPLLLRRLAGLYFPLARFNGR